MRDGDKSFFGGRTEGHDRSRESGSDWKFTNEYQREALRRGLQRLAVFVDKILAERGGLPTVLAFPETSGRPLSAAVEPLLRKAYKENGQELPVRSFVNFDRETDSGVSVGRLSDRIGEMLGNSPAGDVLVIDDVAAQGKTLLSIGREISRQDPDRAVYNFAFIALSPWELKGAGIDMKRFGTGVYGNSLAREAPVDPAGNLIRGAADQDWLERYDAWEQVMKYGFLPADEVAKRSLTGVDKSDTTSAYVSRSRESDPAVMASLRDEFRRIGEQVVGKK